VGDFGEGEIKTDMRNKGVLYIAFGEKYVDEVVNYGISLFW